MATLQDTHSHVHATSNHMLRHDFLRRCLQIVGINIIVSKDGMTFIKSNLLYAGLTATVVAGVVGYMLWNKTPVVKPKKEQDSEQKNEDSENESSD